MIKFNSKHIFAGYIKQLLKSTNLPTRNSSGWTGTDNHAYSYNIKMLNCMRNFKSNSLDYDCYTHEFLGDYLRFYRDFHGIDLMPLYNCFSGRVCDRIKLDVGRGFDTSDKQYVIYMLPAQLGNNYTIAIDESTSIEICCILHDSVELESDLPNLTYQKLPGCKFLQPTLYTALTAKSAQTAINTAAQGHESCVKMLIKVPVTNKSSITVLEGDYTMMNQSIYGKLNTSATGERAKLYTRMSNHLVINLEHVDEISEFKPITHLQLLRINNGISYPFADRLMEYLTGNAITPDETIRDNILRVQEVIKHTKINGKYVRFELPGAWDDRIRAFMYEHMQSSPEGPFGGNHDVLGYVDKDVEASYAVNTDDGILTLNNVDIYPDVYKDSKEK